MQSHTLSDPLHRPKLEWADSNQALISIMKPSYIYIASVALWIALVTAHYILRTHLILTGPRDGDLYAYSWSFQGLVFLIFVFPFWLFALCAMIALEIRHFRSARSKSGTEKIQA